MANLTDVTSVHKCAHEECRCQVASTQEYCNDTCSDADDITDVELQCNCGHGACALD